MVDNLAGVMHRAWNLVNRDATNVKDNNSAHHSSHSQALSRKVYDHNNHHNGNNNQHHHAHQHHKSMQSLPMITTTDHSDSSSLSAMHISQGLVKHHSFETRRKSNEEIKSPRSSVKYHKNTSNNYEHINSPRLTSHRSLTPSKQLLNVPLQQHSSLQTHLTVNSPSIIRKNHDDRHEESISDNDNHHHHDRLSRRNHQPLHSNKSRSPHASHSPSISHHDRMLANTISRRPFRLIFMRHSERANQALGSDWFNKAFRTNSYKSYDQNLPIALPKRRYDLAYQFDAPLTVRGLKHARCTGRAMLNSNLVADVCLSSTALRCIQTCERILTGMERRDQISIRIEPGLFECPHLNQKLVDSFMTKKELVDNGYNIKLEYNPLISKVNVPESLDEYFHRCATVMRGIVDRYSQHGGNVLIVTHAPGLLALTDAIKGVRPNQETFYRTVAAYPPLAVYIAEFDGTKWKLSEQPYSIAIEQ